jgi:VCBS repeat protein
MLRWRLVLVALAALPLALASPNDNGITAALAQWRSEYGAGWWPWGVAIIDYDGDGDGDLCITQHNGGSRILRNDSGTFSWAAELPCGTFRPKVWDFDGDGWLDIGYREDVVNTFFANKGGAFTPLNFGYGTGNSRIRYTEPGRGFGDDFAWWEWTGDGFRLGNWYNPDWDALPASVQDFVWQEWQRPGNRFLSVWFDYGDLDGDGRDEVFVNGFADYGRSRFTRVLTRLADGSLRDDTEARGFPLTDAVPVYVGDLNGDGRADVVACGKGLYLSSKSGPHMLTPGAVTDFVGRDSVWPLEVLRTPEWLIVNDPRGRGTAIYGADLELLEEIGSWDGEPVAVGDIDGDGALDLAVGTGDTVLIYYGSVRAKDTNQ